MDIHSLAYYYIVVSVGSKHLKLFRIYKHCGIATSRVFALEKCAGNVV